MLFAYQFSEASGYNDIPQRMARVREWLNIGVSRRSPKDDALSKTMVTRRPNSNDIEIISPT